MQGSSYQRRTQYNEIRKPTSGFTAQWFWCQMIASSPVGDKWQWPARAIGRKFPEIGLRNSSFERRCATTVRNR